MPLDVDKLYSVCTRDYMARGRDGYDMLRDNCKVRIRFAAMYSCYLLCAKVRN